MPRLDPGDQVGATKPNRPHAEPHGQRERRIAAARLPQQGIAHAAESRRRFRAQNFGFGVDRRRVAASAALVAPGRCFHAFGLAQVSKLQIPGNPSGRSRAGKRRMTRQTLCVTLCFRPCYGRRPKLSHGWRAICFPVSRLDSLPRVSSRILFISTVPHFVQWLTPKCIGMLLHIRPDEQREQQDSQSAQSRRPY